MKINDNNKFEHIDSFLNGGMTQDEIDSFKAFLQSDKDLAFDTALTQELQEASSFDVAQNDLLATLNNIRSEDQAESAKPNSGLLKMALMALLLGMLSIALVTVFKKMNTVHDIPLQAMAEPLELTSKSNDGTMKLIDMQTLYNNGEYAAALPLIESYLVTKPQDLDVLLAKGIALAETDHYTQAHKVYESMALLQPRVPKYKYYQALTYLKSGDQAKAKVLLEDLVASRSYKHNQAKELLVTLK